MKNLISILFIAMVLSSCTSTYYSSSSSSSNDKCYAKSGACSSHGGVDCDAGPDDDGSVICEDGWRGSSVDYKH